VRLRLSFSSLFLLLTSYNETSSWKIPSSHIDPQSYSTALMLSYVDVLVFGNSYFRSLFRLILLSEDSTDTFPSPPSLPSSQYPLLSHLPPSLSVSSPHPPPLHPFRLPRRCPRRKLGAALGKDDRVEHEGV
jgi:hypothetical protein